MRILFYAEIYFTLMLSFMLAFGCAKKQDQPSQVVPLNSIYKEENAVKSTDSISTSSTIHNWWGSSPFGDFGEGNPFPALSWGSNIPPEDKIDISISLKKNYEIINSNFVFETFKVQLNKNIFDKNDSNNLGKEHLINLPEVDFDYKLLKSCEGIKISLPKELYVDIVNKITFIPMLSSSLALTPLSPTSTPSAPLNSPGPSSVLSSVTCDLNEVLSLGSIKLLPNSKNQSIFVVDKKMYMINSIELVF